MNKKLVIRKLPNPFSEVSDIVKLYEIVEGAAEIKVNNRGKYYLYNTRQVEWKPSSSSMARSKDLQSVVEHWCCDLMGRRWTRIHVACEHDDCVAIILIDETSEEIFTINEIDSAAQLLLLLSCYEGSYILEPNYADFLDILCDAELGGL